MWWVVSNTPRPIYPRERPGTHCTGGWVRPRAGLDGMQKISSSPGFDPRTVQPVASRYIDWAIPVHNFNGKSHQFINTWKVIWTNHSVYILGTASFIIYIVELPQDCKFILTRSSAHYRDIASVLDSAHGLASPLVIHSWASHNGWHKRGDTTKQGKPLTVLQRTYNAAVHSYNVTLYVTCILSFLHDFIPPSVFEVKANSLWKHFSISWLFEIFMRSLYKRHKIKPLFGGLSVFLSARNQNVFGTT